ncbi:MAG: phospho-sugar mutase [Candidatus Nanopelagicales bacterium]
MTGAPGSLDDLLEIARTWAAEDPDPATRDGLRALMEAAASGDAAALAELADAFDGTLQFGTAGLRGRLGPGSNRMNRVVVARAAAGLAAYLIEHGGTSIVIGYDARRDSDVFAHDTARIMAGAGISAMVLPRALPTPVTAFAIHALGTSAAVMVTASHNPPEDNGYKVYLGDGAQIVPPADAEISHCIAGVGAIAGIPRSDNYVTLDDGVLDGYIAQAEHLLPPGPRDIATVYTAMHGVGGEVFLRAARGAGFPDPRTVAAQFAPDGRFPTVRFPNPEEPGAMDLALAEAAACGADLVIAHDPDADRCAVGIPTDDGYRMLTGDEVGWLLGWWTIERRRRAGETMTGTLAQSIVSGTLLRAIALDAGLDYAVTLTGFKWIARVPGLLFGYEEALGYCVDPAHVTDKDGITASLLVMEMAAHLKAQNRGIQDVLADLAHRFGLYLTSQVSRRVSDVALVTDAMARLRSDPPHELGGRAVKELVELEAGADGLPPTDGLLFALDGARVIVRPSGTEPKLKCYLQVVTPVDGDLAAATATGQAAMEALRDSVSAALALA